MSLRETLGDTLKALGLRAHEKGIELIGDIDPSVPDRLVGDPVRIKQVITNLIGNAIKFTSQGEVVLTVTVESRNVDSVILHFAVSDTGIGIPPDKLSVIFEAFSQADGSITRKYGGTGLGLTISTRLVEMMHGKLTAESTPGEGSTFHFTALLGLCKDESPKGEMSSDMLLVEEELAILENREVLIVEDNATTRKVLSQMLRTWRMKPTCVESGEGSLALLQESNKFFDYILLDIQLPGKLFISLLLVEHNILIFIF